MMSKTMLILGAACTVAALISFTTPGWAGGDASAQGVITLR
jgi:hypothetical protein